MTVTTSAARHLLLRLTQPTRLPEAILAALRDEVVLAGWMRASGILSDVEVRVGTAGAPRRISGRVHVIALEGSVGLANGDVSCGMRAVLACETESGVETIVGEITDARIEALEVLVAAFDEIAAERKLDPAGAWVLDPTAGLVGAAKAPARSDATSPAAPAAAAAPIVRTPAPEPVKPAPAPSGFSDVVRAAEIERVAPPRAPAPAPEPSRSVAPKPSPTFSPMNQAMPQRIARPVEIETEDEPVPEPGDLVEHFAFGRCEVVKTEGDRLHVRLHKDQRIKEIALEMLKVTALPAEEGQEKNLWKLARRL